MCRFLSHLVDSRLRYVNHTPAQLLAQRTGLNFNQDMTSTALASMYTPNTYPKQEYRKKQVETVEWELGSCVCFGNVMPATRWPSNVHQGSILTYESVTDV